MGFPHKTTEDADRRSVSREVRSLGRMDGNDHCTSPDIRSLLGRTSEGRVSRMSVTMPRPSKPTPAPTANASENDPVRSTMSPAASGPRIAPRSLTIEKVDTTRPPRAPPVTSPTTADGAEPRNAAPAPNTAIDPRKRGRECVRASNTMATVAAAVPIRSAGRRPRVSATRPAGNSRTAWTAADTRSPIPVSSGPR